MRGLVAAVLLSACDAPLVGVACHPCHEFAKSVCAGLGAYIPECVETVSGGGWDWIDEEGRVRTIGCAPIKHEAICLVESSTVTVESLQRVLDVCSSFDGWMEDTR